MQQQQLMQPAMAGPFNTTHITTDHIQQYLDENKSLILKILENQNSGKLGECAENQARLQRNLMYLAAIADCQPQPSSIYTQSAMNYMQHQQSQPMVSQSVMAARSPIMYAQQQPYSALQQQQAFSGQLTLQSETNMGVGGTGAFPDFGRSTAGEGIRAASNSRNEANGSAGSAGDQGNNSRRGKGETL